jgi:hypothetical protein
VWLLHNQRPQKERIVNAKKETIMSPRPSRRAEEQKVFAKPEIKRVRIGGGKPSPVSPRAQDVVEPAVPYQSDSGLEWGANESDSNRDWGLNER